MGTHLQQLVYKRSSLTEKTNNRKSRVYSLCRRAVLVMQNDLGYGQRRAYTDEDEAWRSFLENPLTAATKAMMSVNGDDDSAAALSLLYDYYKVPREKRPPMTKNDSLGGDATANKRNHMVPFQEVAMAMTDSRLQVLRTVPFSMVVPGDQQCRDKRDPFPLPDTTVTVSVAAAATAPAYPTKTEAAPHGFPGAHCSRADVHGLPVDGQLKHRHFSPGAQSHAPDSTFPEPFKDGSQEVLPFPGDLQLHVGSAVSANGNSPFHTVSCHNFEYTLEALKSLRQKSAGDPLTYLNKGQFYPINLKELSNGKTLPNSISKARSVVMLVFGEEKSRDEQLKHWKYWHSRQHTAKQRCIDIADYKGSFDTITNMEEIAYNAISFTWDTNEEPRIYVSVNCLSTDFSSQKGVKGLPLSLQIDTYSYSSGSSQPVHRACCQIKVFCDKGAERKVRDEERKQTRRKGKCVGTSINLGTFPDGRGQMLHKTVDVTTFKELSDFDSQPVLFVPDYISGIHHHPYLAQDGDDGSDMKRLLFAAEDEFGSPPSKVPRADKPRKVLLYVRKETDEVFDALMLNTPTLAGLIEAVSDKYKVPPEKFGKVYKRSKKGILVNMDDNIIQHYSNEDTFQIHMEEQDGVYKLTLTEI
ncbi:grainyhead-like protein 1 homolog isoform X2 [Anguilla anguilla]|uniref:grainyhead-like protein 1 homolog isoform X2 n=1 Tax=Anguilla anguilla TaxID=7936 RepID=UPI0015B0DF8A|nr:grainyhead-like protein 1 homolog isoform X2 [Anguilla anguilla]